MREPILPTRNREKITAETRAELDGWIEERAAELTAGGMSLDDAGRQALEEFGDAEGAVRYARRQDIAADRRVRAMLWIDDVTTDARIAVRTLARTPTVTAVVLLTFALGIGATTAVFSLVNAMLLRPLPYGDEATLAFLPSTDDGVIRPGLGGARHSAAGLVALRERTTSFTGIAGATTGNTIMTGGGDPEQVFGSSLTPNAFDVLLARAAIGRTFGAAEESGPASEVVVLLHALWQRRFGADSAIVGRTIEMSGTRREVIGVMPRGFRVPTYELAEYLIPQNTTNILADPNNSQIRFMRLFGRMKSGVSAQVAQADLDRTMRAVQKEFPRTHGNVEARVVPIRAAVAGEARPRLLVLMAAAGFVLLIACANVAGILLARALARGHELAVRVALGAGRGRLVRQFLVEGVVLAVLGGSLGLMVAHLGIGVLRRVASFALPSGTVFALEPRVLAFGIGVAILAAIASSLVPAIGATRVPGVALRRHDGRVSLSRAGRRQRLGLVAGQLAVSVVLLVGAGLFLRSLQRLSALDLGYATDSALTFRLQFTRPRTNEEQDAFWVSVYEQLRGIPGVRSVGGGNIPMSGTSSVTRLQIEGPAPERGRAMDVRVTPASDGYFSALGIPIVRGRVFNATDRDGAPWVALVSATLAKQLWPDGDAIGARVRTEPTKPWATIVGIVGDVRMGGGSADAPQPSIYTSQRQDHWPGGGNVVMRADGAPSTLAAAVRQVVKRVDPTVPVIGLRTLEEFRRSTPTIAERRMQMQLMLAFALVAFGVSAIGVYGAGTYAMEARRQEFGIRMALGASRCGVLWLALRDAASVAVVGAIVGIPLALLLASRVRDLLYSTEPFDPPTVGAVLGALFLVVLAASLAPARRATLIDPAITMRSD